MNRTQRRAAMRAEKRKGMAQKVETQQQFTVNYGHDGECVLVFFSAPVKDTKLTIAQTDAMIEALQVAKKMLLEHQAKAKAN